MFKVKGYCEFCNKKLELSLENHYVASEFDRNGLLITSHIDYDAIDCKNCGRQNIMGVRYKKKIYEAGDKDE